MRIIRRIIAWSLLSLIFQVSVLFILDRFVFRQSSEFVSRKIELNKPYEDKINIKIPNNAENIKISFNGRYMSYDKNGEVIITETKTGKEKSVRTGKNGQILYYEWLPERDRIVIVEKAKKKGKEMIQLATYNPKNYETTYVTELCRYEEGMKVRCVTESIFTNVYYVYISDSDTNDRCYRVDINNDKFDILFKCNNFGSMHVIPHTDRLVYDDLTNN
ncbi:MAG: dipeptidyl-peptidase IV, partial [Clostridium sp.]